MPREIITSEEISKLVKSLKSLDQNALIKLQPKTKEAIKILIDPRTDFSNGEIVKSIYKGLSLLYHPDKGGDEVLFKIVGKIPQVNKDFLIQIRDSYNNIGQNNIRKEKPNPDVKYNYPYNNNGNNFYNPYNPYNQQYQHQKTSESILRLNIERVKLLLKIENSKLHSNFLHNSTLIDHISYQNAVNSYNNLLNTLPNSGQNIYHKEEIDKLKNFFNDTEKLYNQLNRKINIISDINKITEAMGRVYRDMKNYRRFNEKDYKIALDAYENLFAKLESFDPNVKELSRKLGIESEINRLKNIANDVGNIVKEFKAKDNRQPTKLPANRQYYDINFNKSKFLNKEEIEVAKIYFLNNPKISKLSRKTTLVYNGKKINLPFSVIKSNDGRLYAIYSSKKTYEPKQVKGLLGKGSYGRVKLAQSLDDGTIIAAKIQSIGKYDAALEKGIKKEECIQEALNQYLGNANKQKKNLYQVKHYTFSKFIEGKTLTDHFKNKFIPINEKLEIVLKVLKETENLHNKGVVHGDLSFNNILYDEKTGKVNIIDFGFAVANVKKNGIVRLPYVINSPIGGYVAPEYSYGKISCKTDVYSLGRWIQWNANNDKFLMSLASEMLNPDFLYKRPHITECISLVEKQLSYLNDLSGNRDQYRRRF